MRAIPLLKLGLRGGWNLLGALTMCVGVSAAYAQETATAPSAPPGYIEFDRSLTAKASVEVDVSHDMFGDLFGIGDAVLVGVAEGLAQSPQAQQGSQTIQGAAQRAAVARELVSIVRNVVNDVRVRVYDGLQAQSQEAEDLVAHYNRELDAGGWDNVVRVREGAKGVRVSVARHEGSIHGVFISVFEGDELILVNLTCDISPENARKLGAAAAHVGLAAGLGEKLEQAMKHMK